MASAVHDLKTLILSFHSLIAIETVEEERVVRLLKDVSADLGLPLFSWSVTRGLSRTGRTGIQGTIEPDGVLRHIESLTIDGIFLLKDFAPHLKDPALTRRFRELGQKLTNSRATLVVSGEPIELPNEVSHKAVFFDFHLPGQTELKEVFESVVRSLRNKGTFRIDLQPGELSELIRALSGLTLNQARQAIAYTILDDGRLDSSDVAKVIERKARAIRDDGLLEYFPVEDNHFQLGGFRNMKEWLERAALGFSAEARKMNLQPPRGILIVGVQGCGKSLAAKVISRQWKMPLLRMDAGRLYNKYIGESERNFRKAIDLAESMSPTVLWIDEIEKAFSGGGGGGDEGGVSRRLLGGLLTWMQEKKADVFVVATANDLSILPPEFLRKGRFDEIFFVDLPDTQGRGDIFEIHLNLRKQDAAALDLPALIEATDGFSGAEIEQAVIAALYRSLHRKTPLDTGILLEEVRETVPLSRSRREDVARLRTSAEGRFVAAN